MGGGGKVSLLLTVALLGVTVLCNPTDNNVNDTETEGEFLEDALGNWLGNFGTYTFMVEQDVDDTDDKVVEEEELVTEESPVLEVQEEDEEDYDQGSSAPITLGIKRTGGLLNPEVDYKVKLESLVAEGGSVLVTLGSFKTKTSCGVGGFSLPPEFEGRGRGPDGRRNTNHQKDGIRSTTIVAFAVDTEAEETTTTWTVGDEGSAWEKLSENLWWATGKLAGGGLLTLIFTPPECGCLMLRAYYALPLGDNLTLVVGPEAYPTDLETLLCVDPASSHNIQENLIEPEVEEEGVTQDVLEEPTHLQETDNDLDSSGSSVQIGRGRGRWAAARKARRDRKKKRQEARQAIRQAGRRVTKQRIRKHMRLQRRGDETGDNLENRQDSPHNSRQGGKWARKKARKAARKQKQAKKTWKGKKPWKKHRKHARKNGHRNKHNRRNRHNRNQNITKEVTSHPTEAFEDLLEEDEDHFNSTEPQTDEDAVADIILAEEEEEEEPEAGVNTVGSGDAPTRRLGRKHQKQRGRAKNKWRNKEKKKAVKFCCKQGIKFKKSQLLNNTIEEDQPEILCNDTNDIIVTFAEHRFGIESAHCASRFETCCSKFTLQLWENMKGKKAARKAKRKQQRKARQQKRKQLRQQRLSTTTPTTSVSQ